MIDYSEKRDFRRMALECPAHYRLRGTKRAVSATVKNLSGGGALLVTREPLEAGANLALAILPGKTSALPLSAYVRVLRCQVAEEGQYEVACRIVRMLEEDEAGPDFP